MILIWGVQSYPKKAGVSASTTEYKDHLIQQVESGLDPAKLKQKPAPTPAPFQVRLLPDLHSVCVCNKKTTVQSPQSSNFLLCKCMFTCITKFTVEKSGHKSPVKWTKM